MDNIKPLDGNYILRYMQNESGRDMNGNHKVNFATIRTWVKCGQALFEEKYAPVVHARWEHTGIIENCEEEYKCSSCKRDTISGGIYDYCPWCGTKMDLRDDNK